MVCLDLGTSEFRSLRRRTACIAGRKSPAVYVSFPSTHSDVNLLRQLRMETIRCDDSLIVVGAAAQELACSLRIPTIPLLIDGLVPTDDPLGRQLISAVIESILPGTGNGENCGLISRAAIDFEQKPDLQLFAQILRLKGFNPEPVSSAAAVAFAELGDDQFTGLVMDWGASGASLGAYRYSETLVESHFVNGGNLIDERVAKIRNRFRFDQEGNRYLDTQAIEAWMRSFGVRIDRPRTDDEKLLAEIFREQLLTILLRFRTAVNSSSSVWRFSTPVKLVCAGGCTRISGFAELTAQILSEIDFPIAISEIQVCTADSFRSVRGAMICTELDRQAAVA